MQGFAAAVDATAATLDLELRFRFNAYRRFAKDCAAFIECAGRATFQHEGSSTPNSSFCGDGVSAQVGIQVDRHVSEIEGERERRDSGEDPGHKLVGV